MTISATSRDRRPWTAAVAALRRAARTPSRRPRADSAVLRALCHDMRSPLASLEAVLHNLHATAVDSAARAELLEVATAQAEHLASMLRTASAAGGAVESGPGWPRDLVQVMRAAAASSGLPRRQLQVALPGTAAEVAVADARVQRILTNLLENAHRHGRGAPVRLEARRRPRWVRLSVGQTGVPAERVLPHLLRVTPPTDLTGLGLWSVRQQTAELGGTLSWATGERDDFTFLVDLPDR